MTAIKRRRGALVLAGGMAAALVLAACSSGDDSATSESATEETVAEETAAEEEAAAEVAAGCEAYAGYAGSEGTSVTLFTSILPPEQQLFEEAWAEFETCTGIDIVYEGSDQFEAQLPPASLVATHLTSPSSRSPVCSPSSLRVAAPFRHPSPWLPTWIPTGTRRGSPMAPLMAPSTQHRWART